MPEPGSKFQRFRARRSAQGMKELRLWVPDTSRPEFTVEMRRQVLLIRDSPEDLDALAFIEATTDWQEDS